MSKELPLGLMVEALSNEKGISQEVIFQALEVALAVATKKKYDPSWEFEVKIKPATGEYDTARIWKIVPDERGDEPEHHEEVEIILSEAKKKDPEAEVGGLIREPVESIDFSRIAAQSARQVILQLLRQAKRDKISEEYLQKVGQLLTGTVKKVTRDFIIMELPNGIEGILSRSALLPKEIFRVDDRVRAYLESVDPTQKGPPLVFSRIAPNMIVELFKIEVPEIGDGLIEIKGAARDPGVRAKIAVHAKDARLDPVGACVGMRGTRVQAVSNELGQERVDIVIWDANPAQYVINAIAPAEVLSIVVDEDAGSMDVIVEEGQLSQAIGRHGQNVRLASELTGWKINIMSEAQASERTQEEQQRYKEIFINQLHLDDAVAQVLVEGGFTTIEEVAYVPVEELEALGFEAADANKLHSTAETALISMAMEAATMDPGLLSLPGMDILLAQKLVQKGIADQEALAELSVEDLQEIVDLNAEKAKNLIMAARAPWFES